MVSAVFLFSTLSYLYFITKPTTELESSIDQLLKSAKMRDEDIQQTEELAMNHLTVEEVAARRAELRQMRELMFRAEVKAKRVSKIKSKTYRRIKKKEREKLAKKLDGDIDLNDDEDGRLKREVERARERATLRHKNTGKWAKAMRAKGELDVDERRDISEMLERGEQLRRKIRGDKGSDYDGEDDEEDDVEDDDDKEGEGFSRIKARAFEELDRVNKDDEDDGTSEGHGKKGKTIFEMKFMQDAMARNRQQTDRMVDDFVQEMEDREGDNEVDRVEEAGSTSAGPAIQRTGGRAVYRPAAAVSFHAHNPLHLFILAYLPDATWLDGCSTSQLTRIRYLECDYLECDSPIRRPPAGHPSTGTSANDSPCPASISRRIQPVACPS